MNPPTCCSDCVQSGVPPEIYNTVEDLEAHIAGDHLSMFPYECEKCKFAKFPTEYALVSHSLSAHGILEFSIKYRYTADLAAKRKELSNKLEQCINMSRNDPVSSTVVKVEGNIATATATPIPSCSPQMYDNAYQAFLDEAFHKHEEEKVPSVESPPVESAVGPIKVKQQIQCTLCGDVVSRQRSSMVYHANTRHGKYELYECGYCHRKWQTIAKSDVIKHIRSHHERQDGSIDQDMVIDYRKNLGHKLREITAKCFPEKKKKRIGYTDAPDHK